MRPLLKTLNVLLNHIRKNSNQAFREVTIPVPWGHIAGKWWGPTDVRPILTIHGWQDNCGAFDKFVPLLDGHSFLAIDLPGHGRSSWLPAGMFYHYIDYIVLCRYLKQYFKWNKVSLMGHSLGAIVCYGYTMYYPKDVDFLVALDGLQPLINYHTPIPQAIDLFCKFSKYACDNTEPPSYTIEEIKQKICEPNNNSVSWESSEYLVERNVQPSQNNKGKYYFTRDPRLKVFETTSFCIQDLIELAKNISAPIMLIKADRSGYFGNKKNFQATIEELKKVSDDFQLHHVEGTHHFLLNNPEAAAKSVNTFIGKHSGENRKIDMTTNDIINS